MILETGGAEGMKTGKGLDGSSEDVETQSTCHQGLKLPILLVETILDIRGMEEKGVFCMLGFWKVEWINDCGQRKRKRDVGEEKEEVMKTHQEPVS